MDGEVEEGVDSEERALISIVVPTYNRSEMLRGALESLADLKLEPEVTCEIVVVDNASTDATREVVEELRATHPAARFRYVFEAQQGQAYAINRGAAEARGAWIALFDDDELAPGSWLMELWKTAQERDAEIVGGPCHLDLDERQRAAVDPICRGVLREFLPYDEVHRFDGSCHPGGGNVLIARRIFDRLGGFNTELDRGYYDTDFFIRARSAGVPAWYTPHGGILHRIPAYRLDPEHFRWDARRTGDNLAFTDLQYRSQGRMALLALARIGQAALINLPLWILARARNDAAASLGRRTLLWRCEGYVRRALSLTFPVLFAQREFFESMEFRKGRELEECLSEKLDARESQR